MFRDVEVALLFQRLLISNCSVGVVHIQLLLSADRIRLATPGFPRTLSLHAQSTPLWRALSRAPIVGRWQDSHTLSRSATPAPASAHHRGVSSLTSGSRPRRNIIRPPPKMQTRDQHIHEHINVPRRIYIQGTGSVGKLIAHSIRGVPDPPPVTLLFHRPTFKKEFEDAGRVIRVKTGKNVEERAGFDSELVLPDRYHVSTGQRHHVPADKDPWAEQMSDEPITNLIVSVKVPDTVAALRPIRHRLGPESTILFMQNGMGVLEECNEKLFPDPKTRPGYMLGVNSHGIHATSSLEVTHAGAGTIMLGIVPRIPFKEFYERKDAEKELTLWTKSSRYLLRAVTRVPVLAAVPLSPTELLQAQLEKLAVNCIINPLTVMLDCRNGNLLNNFAITRTMFLLLVEISTVIQALPELSGIPNLKLRFSPERLEHLAVSVAQKTGENISSMLQDTRRGARTEVEYINGYIVKRGEELGIKPVMNYMLMQMVMGKQQMISKEIDDYSPFGAARLRRPVEEGAPRTEEGQ